MEPTYLSRALFLAAFNANTALVGETFAEGTSIYEYTGITASDGKPAIGLRSSTGGSALNDSALELISTLENQVTNLLVRTETLENVSGGTGSTGLANVILIARGGESAPSEGAIPSVVANLNTQDYKPTDLVKVNWDLTETYYNVQGGTWVELVEERRERVDIKHPEYGMPELWKTGNRYKYVRIILSYGDIAEAVEVYCRLKSGGDPTVNPLDVSNGFDNWVLLGQGSGNWHMPEIAHLGHEDSLWSILGESRRYRLADRSSVAATQANPDTSFPTFVIDTEA